MVTFKTVAPVTRGVAVARTPEEAFRVFTERMGEWWPLETHHIGEQPAQTAVIEPYAGGRWFERAADGTECDWGRVIAWEPPDRIVLGWHLGPDWKYDPDEATATEVEIRFTAERPGRTRVELEHRGFERLGDRAEELRAPVASENGWSGLLERYRAAAEA